MNNGRFGVSFPQIRIRHVVIAAKVVSAFIFLFASLQIVLKWVDYNRGRTTYEEIREIAHRSSASTRTLNIGKAAKPFAPSTHDSETASSQEHRINPLFLPLIQINNDTVGWIQIPGTRIDYPIVQAKDNDFYLDHDFKKKRSSVGAIFMDYRDGIDPLNQNTVLYGHHMKDGSMFKDLVKFQDKAFLQNHPTIHLKTRYEDTTWRIFAVYVTDVGFDYMRPQYESDDDFHSFVDTIKTKAKLPDQWTIGKDDRILTLSTCSYDFGNARLVVQAVLDDSSK